MCIYGFLGFDFTFLQALQPGWITSRQIEAAVLISCV